MLHFTTGGGECQGDERIIYLKLLSDTDNLLSVWDNLLSVAIVI